MSKEHKNKRDAKKKPAMSPKEICGIRGQVTLY
jgi:hypothetical protein